VRFGTIAHYALLLIHADGRRSQTSIRRDLLDEDWESERMSAAVSRAMDKLVKHGFVHRVGWERGATGQSCWVYSLDPPSKPAKRPPPLTVKERSRISRAARSNFAASVFDYRGSISLNRS
jgi:hypothetical protein